MTENRSPLRSGTLASLAGVSTDTLSYFSAGSFSAGASACGSPS